jgi:hypothetical protein
VWACRYIKDVTASRLGTDFDDAFRHILPTQHSEAGLEDLRSIFFTDFMDTTAEEPHQRAYDEAQVLALVLLTQIMPLVARGCASKAAPPSTAPTHLNSVRLRFSAPCLPRPLLWANGCGQCTWCRAQFAASAF